MKQPSTVISVRPSSVVYWSRLVLAIIGALLAFLLRLKSSEMIVLSALAIYLLSCIVYKYGLRYGERELKGRFRYITLGIGTFLFVWLFSLTLLHTLFPY